MYSAHIQTFSGVSIIGAFICDIDILTGAVLSIRSGLALVIYM